MTSTAIPEQARTRATGLAVVGTALHAALGLALFGGYAVYVPAARRMLREFRAQLPPLAAHIVRVSEWVEDHKAAVFFAVLGALALDFVLIRALGRRASSLPVLWVVGAALAIAGTGAVTTWAIEDTMNRLREGLAK